MQVAIVGAGYVGLSLATLISRKHDVTAVEVVPKKVRMINERRSPIADREIERTFAEDDISLRATGDISEAKDAGIVIIATPTNYDPANQYFDCSSVEGVLDSLRAMGSDATNVIKSTIPVGFTERMYREKNLNNLIFSPEFLREGRALYDNLHPARIVTGVPAHNDNLDARAKEFAELMRDCSLEPDVPIIHTRSTEAECIKLFSNTYLAMRVAYFNELDTYAQSKGLDTEDIIKGMCYDPRIGDMYNNPSFGYGGYCLPKDTKQLLSNFEGVPQNMIGAIVDSNDTRKQFICDSVYDMLAQNEGRIVGAYKLAMKSGSDNFRATSILDVMKRLADKGVDIVIYEPTVKEDEFMGWRVVKDLSEFKRMCDVIITNRMPKDLKDVEDKVYCRDIFNRD